MKSQVGTKAEKVKETKAEAKDEKTANLQGNVGDLQEVIHSGHD